ncbi:helix-turn-helix transcriptional regulator [Enterobacter roggenkampii]|uniref:helix-turn-helix transcriptional regulator n=1 Tax=Enterobacter roggenkampii TaxID=1812935 RepID=UPI0012383C8C|nr:helix-turn-helix transcriptional regulator [Enterobacter roggenkampii]
MFTFTVFSRVIRPTLLNGFLSSLQSFCDHHSGWNYELVRHDHAHLIVLDFTVYDTLDALTDAELESLCRPDEGTVLVMLSACQGTLARHLIKAYRCSLLCVDEHQLDLRELITLSTNKRRYISSYFMRLDEQAKMMDVALLLTKAEIKVLNGLNSGKNGADLSREMFRSQKTISAHKRKIMLKLGVKTDLELRRTIQNFQMP